MTTPFKYETLIKYHSTEQLMWVLEDMGHDVAVFDCPSDFNAYVRCLADGTCGDEGQDSYRELCDKVALMYH